MSITLLCLVKGNALTNAFPVHIDKDQLVGDLKKAIKAEKQNDFAGVDADRLRLWNVKIPDDQDDLLSNLTFQDQTELLATREIGDYWTEKPAKRHIHVLVESPVSTATSGREQELLEEVASLQALLKKSTHSFDVVVSPKRTKGFTWAMNIEHATLDGLKEYIRKMEKPPALENDAAMLKIVNDSGKYTLLSDQDLREMLRLFVSNKNLKFTVFIETPSKPFNEWTFPKVCELYGLSDDPSPSIDVFPVFSCGCVELKDEKSRTAVNNCYLASGVSFYEDDFKIIPEKFIEGRNGQGNLDYAIECRSTGRVLGLIEVKREDFMKGFAQASVQMESSLTGRKRKANEIDDEQDVDKVFGIVTDARDWYFMECTLDREGKPSFKLSESVSVEYRSDNLQNMVEEVLSRIVRLLKEAQKPVKTSQSGVKRVRSAGNLAGKSN